jgi:hypothetical protein
MTVTILNSRHDCRQHYPDPPAPELWESDRTDTVADISGNLWRTFMFDQTYLVDSTRQVTVPEQSVICQVQVEIKDDQ